MLPALVAEFVATFTLTFIGVGAIVQQASSANPNLVAIAVAHGLALAMAVYATGHISGGHVNPAVTIAMLVTKKIQAAKAAGYIVAQCLGATVAAFAVKSLFPAAAVATANLGMTLGSLSDANPADNNLMACFIIEAILTFLLVWTIFGTAVDSRGPKNVYGFAIGLTIAFDILAAGPLTGASMNPARSFGPALIQGNWTSHCVYWGGPILGACIAALLYQNVLIKEQGK